jgi:putative membrane protein
MIKNEWRKLAGNKIMIGVMIALLLIPSIYTTLFLGSMWDPFAKLDRLPVAVVNEDKGTVFEGKSIQAGEDLVEELKEDGSLKFDFVDKNKAERGLRNGSYYMMIDIPEDFSQNAASVLDEEPVRMQLDYYTSPGKNYIASRLGEGAMEKIKGKVSEAVSESYANVMVDLVGEVSDGMQDAADGAQELWDGLLQIREGQTEIEDHMETLADGTTTLSDGAKELADGTKTLLDGTQTYVDGVGTAKDGADRLADGTGQLKTGAEALSDGAETYVDGVSDYTDGVDAYIAGVNRLSDGAKQLSGLEKLGDVSSAVTQISENVNGEENKASLCAGTKQLSDGLQQLSDTVSSVKDSATNENIKQLSQALAGAKQIVDQSNGGISQAASGLSEIGTQLGELSSQVDGMADTMSDEATKQANIAIGKMETEANNQINQANERIDKENAAIDEAISRIEESSMTDEEKTDLKNVLSGKKQEKVDPVSAPKAAVDLSGISSRYKQGFSGAATKLSEAKEAIGQITDALPAASENLGKISAALSNAQIDEDMIGQLSAGLDQAARGAASVNSGAVRLGAALDQLEEGTASFPQAAAGMRQLNAGFLLLTSNNDTLTDGGVTLNEAGKTLLSGAESATEGAKTLDDGMQTLQSGLKKLDVNGPVLLTGTERLYTGAKTLSAGTVTLADGSRQLADGTHELGDALDEAGSGSGELADGLADGVDEINEHEMTDQTAEMFAAPVELNETEINDVKNNGHFMASYMMNVGLWVACIAFTLMYPLLNYEGELKSGSRWWLSKASVLYPLSILMALLMILVLHRVLGFTPMDMGKTLLVACVASISYMSMLYFFCVLFGKVGNFIMLIFTVVQLAGSAGTYPLEMSGHYANLVHKWLPFSYGVDAFRETIATGGSIWFDVSRLAGYAVLFSLLTIAIFVIRSQKIRRGKPTIADRIKRAEI